MRQTCFALLAGMLVVSAGCRSPQNCAPQQAQVQPLPYSFSDHRQNDRGGYFKEQMTITREGGSHDRSKSTHTGGNQMGGNDCPPGTPIEGNVKIVPGPTVIQPGLPTLTPPPGK